MKTTASALLASAAVALAQDYAPFEIPHMSTHQPNGNPAGQVNYYNIDFNITSKNGDSPQTGYCNTFWGDNGLSCGDTCSAESKNVPAGEWIQCKTEYLGDVDSEFAFWLFPGFSIGNFPIQLKQNFTQTFANGTASNFIATAQPYTISNDSSAYTCKINPQEVEYQQHAQGDCSTPVGSSGFTIPVTSVTPACTHATTVKLNWAVNEPTSPGDNVFVVGNITALGNWDPYNAVALSADGYTGQNPVWHGGDVEVEAGTPFEYKFIQWSHDGTLLWECGENWAWTVGEFTCGGETVGTDPTWFRCGNH